MTNLAPDSTRDSTLLQALESFGLSANEARVYLDLLELGQTTAGPLVRRTGLHRQFVYSALEKLEASGLAAHVIRNNRKNFLAAKPDVLLRRERERYRLIQSTVPKLEALQERGDQRISSQVFSGRDELFNNLLTVIDSAQRFDGTVRIMGGGDDERFYSVIGSRYAEYVAYGQSKGVKKRLIAPGPPGPGHQSRFVRERGNSLRYLERGLSTPSYTRITPELVTIEIFGEDVVVLQIWNRTIARSYFEHFELLWKHAVPFKREKGKPL